MKGWSRRTTQVMDWTQVMGWITRIVTITLLTLLNSMWFLKTFHIFVGHS